ncbi:MAG: PadR family transcriptional regulator [Nakamurella sp.]
MTTSPVSEQAFFVLSALAVTPLHGYAILSEVADLSEGRLRLAVGTLYGILDRLASDGSIELDREEIVDSRLRRYYRLTNAGQNTLTRETARQAANARMATARLAAVPITPYMSSLCHALSHTRSPSLATARNSS